MVGLSGFKFTPMKLSLPLEEELRYRDMGDMYDIIMQT